ncbi:MAG: phosphoribosylaminoimidazolesuccinocarboxamide synthase [Gemmatimonadetes bacterium]|nr:phosphoribosylaminoimidazolesuccinocarboxamide synthase [Gemmatimonadota bacterium]NNM04659.1 phosphoribosylaminoimidazolesuccinocarboxamide synthase [Gemmatimonadota bacterium]
MSVSETPGGKNPTLHQSDLPLPLLRKGKVRDVYEAGPEMLLMVASDRVSAFDVVLPQPIPFKGEVLTQITAWWLSKLEDSMDHHLISVTPEEILERVPELRGAEEQWARRSMLVKRTDPILVECVVRGYISGSAWKEYKTQGTLAGEALPEGLVESGRLEPAIFSPATKAEEGDHDENITFDAVVEFLGPDLAHDLRHRAMEIYAFGARTAEERGIILADTKFEFGTMPDGAVLLIDEVMTPDSSRFWPREHYETGRGQASLDKQPIRDYLDGLSDWDKKPPPPDLPPEVVKASADRYLEIFRRLTGIGLEAYIPPRFG